MIEENYIDALLSLSVSDMNETQLQDLRDLVDIRDSRIRWMMEENGDHQIKIKALEEQICHLERRLRVAAQDHVKPHTRLEERVQDLEAQNERLAQDLSATEAALRQSRDTSRGVRDSYLAQKDVQGDLEQDMGILRSALKKRINSLDKLRMSIHDMCWYNFDLEIKALVDLAEGK